MNPLLQQLQALEVELHHPGVRCSRERLEQLLHPEFHEVGRSGRVYDRDTIISHLSGQGAQEAQPVIVSEAFVMAELGLEVVLLTYRSAHAEPNKPLAHHTLRSSIWVKAGAGWQLRYHQGTAAAQTWSVPQ